MLIAPRRRDLSVTSRPAAGWHAFGGACMRQCRWRPPHRKSGAATHGSWPLVVFEPCYIGGWSACEHWGLTQQLFRDVLVVTARQPATLEPRVSRAWTFGSSRESRRCSSAHGPCGEAASASRSRIRRAQSSTCSTSPPSGAESGTVLMCSSSTSRASIADEKTLIAYGDRLGNRTVFKRLGFLVEVLGIDAPDLVAACNETEERGNLGA